VSHTCFFGVEDVADAADSASDRMARQQQAVSICSVLHVDQSEECMAHAHDRDHESKQCHVDSHEVPSGAIPALTGLGVEADVELEDGQHELHDRQPKQHVVNEFKLRRRRLENQLNDREVESARNQGAVQVNHDKVRLNEILPLHAR